MKEPNLQKKIMFKNLLQKTYEKGETAKDISTKELVQDLETELRTILASK